MLYSIFNSQLRLLRGGNRGMCYGSSSNSSNTTSSSSVSNAIPQQHQVSKFNSIILQLTGITKGPVSAISVNKMDKASSRFRIGLMFGVMGMGVVGAVISIRAGKRDRAAQVNTLTQKNQARHAKAQQKMNEQGSSR